MPEQVLAVTGVTGHIGGAVARALAERGIAQRMLARDPSRAPGLAKGSVAAVAFDQPDAARAALDGAEVLLMVSATEAPDRVAHHRMFVDAAVAAGVRHIVYTSYYGAAEHATFTFARDHWATEEHIKQTGVDYTFLRDNFYLDGLAGMGGEAGVIAGPAGDGVVSGIARADVARTATAVLLDPAAHRNITYDLTGPQELTMTQMAEIITEVTGKPTRFHDETVDEAYASRAHYNAPQWELDAWVSTYTAIAAGEMAGVSDAVEKITGRAPTTLRELLVARSG